jgi:hypothetical protein
MPSRLYHFTSADAAAAILRDGFIDGVDPDTAPPAEPGVWLAPTPNAWGERSRQVLLEVTLDLTGPELDEFARNAVADEVWDDEVGDFVPDATDPPEPLFAFLVPVAVVNSRGRVRLVPRDERRRLALGVDDDA